METIPKLSLELARVTGIEAGLSARLESYGTGPIHKPFLDTIELDELQFLRLPADFFHDSRRPSLEVIKYHCRLANASESFYRCISEEQWLRTVIEWQNPLDSKASVTIHSNVVPSQAYLTRLEGMKATCLRRPCSGGFSPTSVLREIRENRPDLDSARFARDCEHCALAEELKRRTQRGAAESARFWSLEVGDVELVEDLGKGSDGTVSKILWRNGTFARKRFKCQVPNQNVHFRRELAVALIVSHPNIVHFFGCSSQDSSNSVGDSDLFMELLNKDLGRFINEGARLSEGIESPLPFQLFLFQDSLDVLLQVAQAMKHLHEKNFVHGDLKPQNILIDCFALTHNSDAQYHLVKVADFGCAQRLDPSGATVEPFNLGIGTTKYTAPEVLMCRKHGGAPRPEHPQKIDVYSFGVVAYQVLTGVANLYEGLRNSEITDGVSQGRLRPDFDFNGSTLDGDIRSLLLTLIKSCWTQYPEDRPSFSQICLEIEALLRTCNLNHEHRLRKKKGRSKGKGHVF